MNPLSIRLSAKLVSQGLVAVFSARKCFPAPSRVIHSSALGQIHCMSHGINQGKPIVVKWTKGECRTGLMGATQIRQQSAPTHLNPSTLAVFREVIRADGLRGLYRGFPATALRDIAYGPYFCT